MRRVDILGIDLGTTKSVIAIWDPDREQDAGKGSKGQEKMQDTRVLPNREGKMITPSVVVFDEETGEAIVGQKAVDRMLSHPEQVIYSVKRFIGRDVHDEWVHFDRQRVTYCIGESEDRQVVIRVDDHDLTPPEVSAEVLRKLKQDAEAHLDGQPITQAVVSVPAYFNESQRRATKHAGELAGLFVPRIIPEPTAAALAFGLGKTPETVAVYDLGGGTFDISILEIKDTLFRVKSIGGNTHLGGDDFDHDVALWMKEQFEKQHPDVILPFEEDQVLRARMREAAKNAKIQLSDMTETRIQIPDLWAENGQPLGLDATLTREKFEDLIDDHLRSAIKIVADTIEAAKIKPADLSQILMVGGQTRTPAVRQSLKDAFDRPLNTSVLPEEAVARGAAVLGARLCGYLKDRVSLWDAIPLSLGVELASGAMDVVIPRNEPIPVEKWRRGDQAFTTQKDGQKSIRFKVWQGERPMAADNSYVGEVILLLTTSRPAGEHRVNVLFKVDHNGIVTVRAESADTDARPAEAVFAPGSMTPAEVQKRLEEAARHREEDELTRRLIELRAELVGLREYAGDDAGAELETLFEQAADALDGRDADRAAQLIDNGKEQIG